MEYILMIKEHRLSKHMTQEELARKSKLKQSYISDLENELLKIKSPTLRTIFKIAKALDVCPHKLVKYNINCNQNCFSKCDKTF